MTITALSPLTFAGKTRLPKGVYNVVMVDKAQQPLSSRTQAADLAITRLGELNPGRELLDLPDGRLQYLTRHYTGAVDHMMAVLQRLHRSITGSNPVGEIAQGDQILAQLEDDVRQDMRGDAELHDLMQRMEWVPAAMARFIGRVYEELPPDAGDFFGPACEIVSSEVAQKRGGTGILKLKVNRNGHYKLVEMTPPGSDSKA